MTSQHQPLGLHTCCMNGQPHTVLPQPVVAGPDKAAQQECLPGRAIFCSAHSKASCRDSKLSAPATTSAGAAILAANCRQSGKTKHMSRAKQCEWHVAPAQLQQQLAWHTAQRGHVQRQRGARQYKSDSWSSETAGVQTEPT